MELSDQQIKLLQDNGFSLPDELVVYREYDSGRLGCSFENRFVIRTEDSSYVHNEYVFLDMLMEAAHGPVGRAWKLVKQRLMEKWEPIPECSLGCPCYVDEMTVRLPGRQEETYYFDITAGYLSADTSELGAQINETAPETNGGGFKESPY